MLIERYCKIDKSIISEGLVFDFNIYIPSETSDEIAYFKVNGEPVTTNDLRNAKLAKALYIEKREKAHYEIFCKRYLHDKNSLIQKLISSNEQIDESYEKKAQFVYDNAVKAMNELFESPEKLANYKEAKKTVDNMVNIILDKDFTIKSLMSIASHDYYTHTHSINVSIYSISLGKYLNLKEDMLMKLGEAALLHDLGKSQIDSKIINKKGKLTDKEFREIQKHPLLGYKLAVQLGIKNKSVLDGIRHHHEKMDGRGYPYGLMNNEIPLFARIIGLCDVFDALTSERSYKEAMRSFEALKLMKIQAKEEGHLDIDLLHKMILMFRDA